MAEKVSATSCKRKAPSKFSALSGAFLWGFTSTRLNVMGCDFYQPLKGTSKNSISVYLFPLPATRFAWGETGMRYQKEMIEFLEIHLIYSREKICSPCLMPSKSGWCWVSRIW